MHKEPLLIRGSDGETCKIMKEKGRKGMKSGQDNIVVTSIRLLLLLPDINHMTFRVNMKNYSNDAAADGSAAPHSVTGERGQRRERAGRLAGHAS